MPTTSVRLVLAALGLTALLMGVFAGFVWRYERDLRREIHDKMIGRYAAVLSEVAQEQVTTSRAARPAGGAPGMLLAALLPQAHREGLLALAIFDADGIALDQVPSDQVLVELPVADFAALQNGRPIARLFPEFALSSLFPGRPATAAVPVLEVLLPLRSDPAGAAADPTPALIGFVRYHLDARALVAELATLDQTVRHQTTVTLALGLSAIALILAIATGALVRAQRIIAERTERLKRANFELSLAAKASVVGQITSHLIHGLQGPVAGLRAAVSRGSPADWASAADYTARLQQLIQETVDLLSDTRSEAYYELTLQSLAETIRTRHGPAAAAREVRLSVAVHGHRAIDNRRGGLLCLIAANLVENALAATPAGLVVSVSIAANDGQLSLEVADDGGGIPAAVLPRLFEPGVSSRPEGTGLGLAISQLLARHLGGDLALVRSGPSGTLFRLTLPLDAREELDETGAGKTGLQRR